MRLGGALPEVHPAGGVAGLGDNSQGSVLGAELDASISGNVVKSLLSDSAFVSDTFKERTPKGPRTSEVPKPPINRSLM